MSKIFVGINFYARLILSTPSPFLSLYKLAATNNVYVTLPASPKKKTNKKTNKHQQKIHTTTAFLFITNCRTSFLDLLAFCLSSVETLISNASIISGIHDANEYISERFVTVFSV